MLRRRVLTEFPSLLNFAELEFVRDWTTASLKNYQVWFHRRWVVERLLDRMRETKPRTDGDDEAETSDASKEAIAALCEDELQSVTDVLRKDAKNMSAWSHRVWLRRVYPRPLAEDFSWALQWLHADPFNNSAWMFRQLLAREKAERRGRRVTASRDEAARSPSDESEREEAPQEKDQHKTEGDPGPGVQEAVSAQERERRTLRHKAKTWMAEVRFSLVSWSAQPSNEAACRYLLHAASQTLAALREIDGDREDSAQVDSADGGGQDNEPSADEAKEECDDADDEKINSERLLQILRRAAHRVCERVANRHIHRPAAPEQPSTTSSSSLSQPSASSSCLSQPAGSSSSVSQPSASSSSLSQPAGSSSSSLPQSSSASSSSLSQSSSSSSSSLSHPSSFSSPSQSSSSSAPCEPSFDAARGRHESHAAAETEGASARPREEAEAPCCWPRGEAKGALRFALEVLLFCAEDRRRLAEACAVRSDDRGDPSRRGNVETARVSALPKNAKEG
uniref:Protein farnesyltransferase/geranylgeranyltransferase type-1 subunit alpha n=1 Tax=Neospora caninum (strain Liverpool) TaxID=572307 RepID=A0A0F7U6N3_NEOCL|nr:TPA: hypothetical protein BN1204_006520 [Neospora caninum Liverpool]